MNIAKMLHNNSKLIQIGLVANILEWYEFSIYVFFITTMSRLYFPAGDSLSNFLQAWALFSFSYLARPLGSVYWGYIGDTKGHSHSLKVSLLLMAIPTIFIGLLPTYNTIGVLAPISLFVLRLIQGFAAGGELPISACYVFENSASKWRSILCSTVATGSNIGLLMASLIAAIIFWSFDPESIVSKGLWRIPYLLSIPMTLWIFYIRSSIESSIQPTEIKSIKQHLIAQKNTLVNVCKTSLLPFILVVGFMEVCFYSIILYLPSYLEHFLKLPSATAKLLNTLTLCVHIPMLLLSGYIAEYITYKRVLILHTLALILLSYPLFYGLQYAAMHHSFTGLLGIQFVLAYLVSGLGAVMMEALGYAYPSAIRASGMSMTHTLAATIFGGTTPVLCSWMIHKTGLLLFPAFYIISFGVIILPILLRLQLRSSD